MGDINRTTGDVTLYNETGDKVAVIQDGSIYRLGVDAKIDSIGSDVVQSRVSQPVHENDGFNNDRTKISYTVPTGKILYIQNLWGTHESNATGHEIEFRINGTPFYWMAFNNDAITTFEKQYPINNPYELQAGDIITAYRIEGNSSQDWAVGFDGYLEDA